MISSLYLMYLILTISFGVGLFLIVDGIEYKSVTETAMGMLIVSLSIWVLSI